LEAQLRCYENLVLPRLLNLTMRRKRLAPLRENLLAAAGGRVLEVGVGSGLNLPFYRRDVTEIIGVDSSLALLHLASRNAAWAPCPVKLLEGSAERLPLASASVDQVVMTWTLCSIAEPLRALAEIRRVLRPGGALLFIEHGRAAEPGVRRWQDRLTPFWRRLAGNCHLNRPVDQLIDRSGLQLAELETGYPIRGPKFGTFFYQGRALA
jgi:ubiquinone/menaquinone biosynthesis C-methylase UbiE